MFAYTVNVILLHILSTKNHEQHMIKYMFYKRLT